MKIGILGGSFNPITKGHVYIAKSVLQNTDLDAVWFTPCYGHLQKKGLIDARHRTAMCKIMSDEQDPPLYTCPTEIEYKLDGSVYDLMTLLKNKTKGYEFSYIIGMDQANNFNTWKHYKKLRETTRFIVLPREGEEEKLGIQWYRNRPHIYLEDIPAMEISSTKVRELIKKWWKSKDTSLEYLILTKIDGEVFEYIKENKLYRK